MKKIKLFALVALASVAVFSCAPEEEEPAPTPTNPKDKWIGSYNCNETCQSGSGPYVVHVVNSSADTVYIENFGLLGFQNKAKAYVNGSSITVPSQIIAGQGISGSGTMQGTSQINLSYVINDGSGPDSCTAVYTKQ